MLTRKILLALPSSGTRFTLVDDPNNSGINGSDGFSVSKMRITKLYFRRLTSDNTGVLKVLNIRLENSGNSNVGALDRMNTVYYYDGVNIPSVKYFCNVITENQSDSLLTYYNNSDQWDYITSDNADNLKQLDIYVYENGTSLSNQITTDNRLYIELEFC